MSQYDHDTDTLDVPFGYDESEDIAPTNCPEGVWEFTVGRKTNASVSDSSGNPMITLFANVSNPPEGQRFWPVRNWFVLRGRGSGMIKPFLKALGHDPDSWMADAQAQYRENGGSPAADDIADFFNREIVPTLWGNGFQGRVFHELDKGGRTNADGDVFTNIRLTDFSPLL